MTDSGMDDLISRAAAVDAIFGCFNVMESKGIDMTVARTIVKGVLDGVPAVEAAPVVRCAYCKHWKCFGDAEDGDYDIGTCELYNQGFGAECFCNNGERRDDDALSGR